MRIDGFDAIVAENFWLRSDAEHERDVGTVDVSIQQTNLVAEFGQRERQIHRECGLSYSAFAGPHRDNRIHAGKRLRALRLTGTRRHGGVQEITFQYWWMKPRLRLYSRQRWCRAFAPTAL